jgi:hypothetical protein
MTKFKLKVSFSYFLLTFKFTVIINSKTNSPPKSLLQIRSKFSRIRTRVAREHSVIDSHCASQPFSRFEQFDFEFEAEILMVSFWRGWSDTSTSTSTYCAGHPWPTLLTHSPSIHEISDFQIFNFHKYSPTPRVSNFWRKTPTVSNPLLQQLLEFSDRKSSYWCCSFSIEQGVI